MRKSRSVSEATNTQLEKFPLCWFASGLVGPGSSYSVLIQDAGLEIWDRESQLSDECLMGPLQLDQDCKIINGKDCMKIILEMRESKGPMGSTTYLDFISEADRAQFLAHLIKNCRMASVSQKDRSVPVRVSLCQ